MPGERCSGDAARRLGEEYLYQTLANENVENLKRYRFRKVLAACPHCFNTIGNEYRQFGGEFEVVHHSVLIAQLVREGRLRLTRPREELLAYHDSCYIGRYNDIYDSPRASLRAIPGLEVIDPPRSRNKGLCCGGGRRAHVDGDPRQASASTRSASRSSSRRRPGPWAPHARSASRWSTWAAKVKGAEDKLQVKDIAELVAEALE